MSNVSQWDNAAANNNDTPPDGWPEGQAPSTVNDCARELMASVSRWYDDQKGELVTAGTSNAYTLTTNSTHAALADQSLLVFRADRANTGAATLNVDSLGAKSMRINGTALASGNIVADVLYAAVYNATDDAYDLQCGLTTSQISTDLGLGTMSTQAASSVAITGGSITGITDLAIEDGGTGASTAAGAVTALGLDPLIGETKYKTTGTARTSATLSDDPTLAGWSLSSSSYYAVDGLLIVTETGSFGGGIKVYLQLNGTIDGSWHAIMAPFTGSIDGQGGMIFNSHQTTYTPGVIRYTIAIHGAVQMTSSGTLDLQWAQNTAVDSTTLETGSYITVRKIG
jgi:hypothetical protein